jgi:hypothetical protein
VSASNRHIIAFDVAALAFILIGNGADLLGAGLWAWVSFLPAIAAFGLTVRVLAGQ